MSNRLTTSWTKTAEGAYGATGARGLVGEEFIAQVIRDAGYDVELYEDDKQMQIAGIDIIVTDPDTGRQMYSADVKANMRTDGSFCVEVDSRGWLFNERKTSDRIIHVNPNTRWVAIYERADMQTFVDNTKLFTFFDNYGKQLVKITPKMGGDFIKRIKV